MGKGNGNKKKKMENILSICICLMVFNNILKYKAFGASEETNSCLHLAGHRSYASSLRAHYQTSVYHKNVVK